MVGGGTDRLQRHLPLQASHSRSGIILHVSLPCFHLYLLTLTESLLVSPSTVSVLQPFIFISLLPLVGYPLPRCKPYIFLSLSLTLLPLPLSHYLLFSHLSSTPVLASNSLALSHLSVFFTIPSPYLLPFFARFYLLFPPPPRLLLHVSCCGGAIQRKPTVKGTKFASTIALPSTRSAACGNPIPRLLSHSESVLPGAAALLRLRGADISV